MGVVSMGIPRGIVLELARLGAATVLVESGTYHGDTARWAARHFEAVHTIERSPRLHARHAPELARLPGVTPHLGDSREVLPRIVAGLGARRAVHWLDGHWSGGETAGAGDECPLLGELACLAGRPDDLVLIDDARLFLCAPPAPHDPAQWPTLGDIVAALPAAGGPPLLQVVDDVIFAVPDRPPLRERLVAHARERAARAEERPAPGLLRLLRRLAGSR